MNGTQILLGVTGGIAAYRACELSRLFIKEGAMVRVVMTAAATRFVTPLSFEALTGNAVHSDIFEEGSPGEVLHIALAKWAHIALIAPATANIIGKIASGTADDLLSTVVMALPQSTPVAIAPAMNVEMWKNPILQKKLSYLTGLGKYHVISPQEGLLACGDVGRGKIAENETIVNAVKELLA